MADAVVVIATIVFLFILGGIPAGIIGVALVFLLESIIAFSSLHEIAPLSYFFENPHFKIFLGLSNGASLSGIVNNSKVEVVCSPDLFVPIRSLKAMCLTTMASSSVVFSRFVMVKVYRTFDLPFSETVVLWDGQHASVHVKDSSNKWESIFDGTIESLYKKDYIKKITSNIQWFIQKGFDGIWVGKDRRGTFIAVGKDTHNTRGIGLMNIVNNLQEVESA